MSNLITFVILSFGALVSLFIVWKKLREDYPEADIFSVSMLIVGGTGAGYLLSLFLFGVLQFWVCLMGGLAALAFAAKKFSMRAFEVFEAFVPAVFVFLLILAVTQKIVRQPLWISGAWPFGLNFIEPGLSLGALFIFIILNTRYRRFLWYPSGRIGFASLVTVILYFWTRSAVALFYPAVLLWSTKQIDVLAGIVLGASALVVLYIRSGRDISGDFGILLKISRACFSLRLKISRACLRISEACLRISNRINNRSK